MIGTGKSSSESRLMQMPVDVAIRTFFEPILSAAFPPIHWAGTPAARSSV